MNLIKEWLRRPQNVWLRRALFQIHLWTGIILGLYVLLISVSGSAIVFRNEIYQKYGAKPTIIPSSNVRLTKDQLKAAAHAMYPGYTVTFIWEARNPNQATEIWMEHRGHQKQRLFDPFTGQDIGPSVPMIIRALSWLSDFHTNLLAGEKGRAVNGAGAIFLTLLSLTGLILWWPGSGNWRRGLTIQTKANWKRINWDLHSALGFWTFAFIFMWGATGIYVVWPAPFQKVINRFAPLDYYRPVSSITPAVSSPEVRFLPVADAPATEVPVPARRPRRRRFIPHYSTGDKIVRWLTYLHFGNFAGSKTKAVWALLGLAPVLLFGTGFLMWWVRVVSRELRRWRTSRAPSPADTVPG